MARNSPNQDRLKTLSLQLDAARNDLGSSAVTIRRRLDVPARIRGSLRSHPAAWFGTSIAAGLLASIGLRQLRRRPRHIEASPAARPGHGLLHAGGVAIFAILRPVLQKWLVHQLRRHL